MTVCVQCTLRALLAQESPPSFNGSFESHEAKVHPHQYARNYHFRQLIEAVWTLDDAAWREVERGLREQGERVDVADEDARSLGVLRDFLISGRRRHAAEAGAGVRLPAVPDSRPRLAPALMADVPLTFLIKGRRWWRAAAPCADVPLMFPIKGGSATEGADAPTSATPAWDAERALAALNITEVPFEDADSTVLGYARGFSIAVSPTSPLPHRTRFHELAHVLLGHTAEGRRHGGQLTPRRLRECEADAVAMLCCDALNLPGVEESGSYIQEWWGSGQVTRRSAQRILRVVDEILKAGAPAPGDDDRS